MKLQGRDLSLFEWINGHGFVTSKQVARWLSVARSAAPRRLQKLEEGGFVRRITLNQWSSHLYLLTEFGRAQIHDPLPILSGISVSTVTHDSKLVDLSLTLCEQYPGASFKPVRRLRLERDEDHLSDGLLYLQEAAAAKVVAVELELSRKSDRRLKRIIGRHAVRPEISEVWYYVASPAIGKAISRAAAGFDFIKVRTWL